MTSTILSLLSAPAIEKHTSDGHWRDRTLYAIACGHAGQRPMDVAIRDRHRALTWRDLRHSVDEFAADLAARGVRPGNRVALWMPDRIESVIALLACSRNGYVCCPSPHRNHTVGEVADLLVRMRAAAFIHQAGFGADSGLHDIAAEIGDLSSLRHVYRLSPAGSQPPFAGLIEADAGTGPEPDTDPNRVSYLAFTSGSTGRPKGVMHSDNTLLVTARGIATDWRIDAASVVYSLSPFSHNLGVGALLTALYGGAAFVIHDIDRRHESLFDGLVETGTTYLVGVPTHAMDLLAEMRARNVERPATLGAFRVSGAACPPQVLEALFDLGIEPQSGYGMTETNGHQFTRPGDDRSLIAQSCGRACDGYEIRIWDPDDPDIALPAGETGLLGGRGASLMLGYFDDQIATEASFNAHGWFLTGDLGWVDERGYLRLTGRKKEVIIRGGHNINPARIEDIAMRHPAVEHAAALPLADDRLGERVCLAVKYRNGAGTAFGQVLEHLSGAGLSRAELPEYYLELEAFPLMSNGKIEKNAIARWIAEGSVSPRAVRAERTG